MGEDNVSLENLVFEAWGGDDGGYEYEQTLRLRVERPTLLWPTIFEV